jgi:hypothetical protein
MKTFYKVWLGIGLMAFGFGIAIIILAFFSGATNQRGEAPYSFQETYDNIESIDIKINYGKINIVEGDTFSIDAWHLMADSLTSYNNDGTWYINDESKHDISLFGLRVSVRQLFRWNDDMIPKITITIPKGFVAEEFNLDIDAGEVKVDTIQAKGGSIIVDAGSLEIQNLTMLGESEYHVGAGEMILKNLIAQDIALDCGVGSIKLQGSLDGYNKISCGIGEVKLDLVGSENDYSYDISSGIGQVDIGGRSYHNIDKSINNNSGKHLELDCGIGEISVDFN